MHTDQPASSSSSLGRKALAGGIILIAGWIILKVAIHIVAALFWTVLVVLAVIGVLWALKTLLW